jgi:methionyl-tRNA formyltransferase
MLDADLFVVAAFGKIFGPKLLGLPRLGSVNLHASLLPLYRGASPISAAIFEGRDETGVTLMSMDIGLDTGPMLARSTLAIAPGATTASLTPQLAQLGADLLIEALGGLIEQSIAPEYQDDRGATLTRPLVKADGWIDWTMPAVEIERQVRAMWNWPRGWTTLRGEPVQVHRATVDAAASDASPGTVESDHGRPSVITGEGRLILEVAQSSGSKSLPGPAWLQQSGAMGAILGESGAPEIPEIPMIRRVPS